MKIAEETLPAFTCPTWCTIDHEADGYLKHGHVVHRDQTRTSDGHRIEYWQSTVHTYTEETEPAEVHIGELIQKFTDSDELRRYACDLLGAADQLDAMNKELPA